MIPVIDDFYIFQMEYKENEKHEDHDKDIEKLLDEALDDFKTVSRTTDDDLDEYMHKVDQEATKKAAEDFQLMLENLSNAMQKEETHQNDATTSSSSSSQNRDATKKLSNLIFNDAADDQELAAAFAKLPLSKGSLDDFMETIIQTAVSKEAMYPAVKELYEKFGPYLEEKKHTLDAETTTRFNEQYRILGLLLKCYSEETIDSTSEKDKRAQKIANLWMEMQQYGLPPPELAANLHDANISSSSDPRIENECSLM